VNFLKTYVSFNRYWQAGLALSFLAGTVLVGLGFWGELLKPNWWPAWWHDLGYGLNILASFSAFLIGVPVASIVIETMTSSRVEKIQTEAVTRISLAAWSDFVRSIDDLCTDERIECTGPADTSGTRQVQAEHDLIITAIEECHTKIRDDPDAAITPARELKSFLAEHLVLLKEKITAVDEHFGRAHEVGNKWAYTRSLWQVLDSHVRFRRMELGLEPISQELHTSLLNLLARDISPVSEFLELHRGVSSNLRANVSMERICHNLSSLIQMSDEELGIFIDKNFTEYIGADISGYWQAALSLSITLRFLKANVWLIAHSGWPNANPKWPLSVTESSRH
jgi:hypothetical protein